MNKFIVIISHPRTGTNALIDFIMNNFKNVYDLHDFFRPMVSSDTRWMNIEELESKFNFKTSIETHKDVVSNVQETLNHFSKFDQNFLLKIFPGHLNDKDLKQLIDRNDVLPILIHRDVVDTEISWQKAQTRILREGYKLNEPFSYMDNTDFKINLNIDELKTKCEKLKEFYEFTKYLKNFVALDYEDLALWIENVEVQHLATLLSLTPVEKTKKIKRWIQDKAPHAAYKIYNYEELRKAMRLDRDLRKIITKGFIEKQINSTYYKWGQNFNNLAEIELSLKKKDGYFKVGCAQTVSIASGFNWKNGSWVPSSDLTYRGTNTSLFSRNALNLCAGYNPSTGNKENPNCIQDSSRTVEIDAVDRIFLQVGADNAYYEENSKASILLDKDGVKINGVEPATKEYVDQKIEELKKCLILNK